MAKNLPKIMKAVFIEENTNKLTIGEIPVPQPGIGEVLIRVAVSPINPSDINFIKSNDGNNNIMQITPGFEGSGRIVTAGKGLYPKYLLGKRVAFAAPAGGAWAEYLVISAKNCVAIPKRLSYEQAAMSFVNPLSALAMFNIVKSGKHKAIVSTAAASALGRMILRLGLKENIPIIHIVRKQEQVDLLKSLGGKYILNSNNKNFIEEFRILSMNLKPTLILDAVGGELTQFLIKNSIVNSTIIMYGLLTEEQTLFDGRSILIEGKTLQGFLLRTWFSSSGIFKIIRNTRKTMKLLDNELSTNVQAKFPLNLANQAMEVYQNNMTLGKVLLVANDEDVLIN